MTTPPTLQAFGGAVRVTCFPGNPPTVTSVGPVTLVPRIAVTAFTKSVSDATAVLGSSALQGLENSIGWAIDETSTVSTAGPSLPSPSAVLRKRTMSSSSLSQPAGTVMDTGTGKASEVTYLPALSVAESVSCTGNGLALGEDVLASPVAGGCE